MKQFTATSQITGLRRHFESIEARWFGLKRASWMIALGFILAPAAGHAADVTVANVNNSGAGSLRQAIADAPVSGTINFSPSLGG